MSGVTLTSMSSHLSMSSGLLNSIENGVDGGQWLLHPHSARTIFKGAYVRKSYD